jgi:hypothetical protein
MKEYVFLRVDRKVQIDKEKNAVLLFSNNFDTWEVEPWFSLLCLKPTSMGNLQYIVFISKVEIINYSALLKSVLEPMDYNPTKEKAKVQFSSHLRFHHFNKLHKSFTFKHCQSLNFLTGFPLIRSLWFCHDCFSTCS